MMIQWRCYTRLYGAVSSCGLGDRTVNDVTSYDRVSNHPRADLMPKLGRSETGDFLTIANNFFLSFPVPVVAVDFGEMVDLKLKVEFGGGLELLFSNQRSHLIDIPSTVPGSDGKGQPADIDFLIRWLKDNLLKERPELFTEDTTLCVASHSRV